MSDDPTASVHLLHIGKTGGTSLKQMIKSNGIDAVCGGRPLVLHFHGTRLVDLFSANPYDSAVFFLRHPIARFVSGFNSRLRQGAPIAHIPWKPAEKIAFERFPTPNDLAEALSDADPVQQDRAYVAMDAITHTRMRYTFWLRSAEYLESRLDRIAFVGLQESYAEDVGRLLRVLGVAQEITVEHEHRAPATSARNVSELGEANLREWYAADFELYEWALQHRSTWTADRFVGQVAGA